MVCDHCNKEAQYQIIKENPILTSCTFVCNYHKNKITKQLKEKGIKFTLNKIEPCSCDCFKTKHYSTSLIEETQPN